MPTDADTGTGDRPAARTGRLQSPDLYDAVTGERAQTSRARRGPSRRLGNRHHGSTSSGERRGPRVTPTPRPSRRRTAWALLGALAALLVFVAGIAAGRWSTGPDTRGGIQDAPTNPAGTGADDRPPVSARTADGAVEVATQALLAFTSRDYVSDPASRAAVL